MNHKLLLVAVVREFARLAAAIATYKGARASLAHMDVHMFGALANALQQQGVGRRVSADMLGMVKRAFLRKVSRANASITDRSRSLWEAVYDYIAALQEVPLTHIEQRFSRDDLEALQGVLADMRESGVVRVEGKGREALYRVPHRDEIERDLKVREDATDLVWTFIHHGLTTRDMLLGRGVRAKELDTALDELLEEQRVEREVIDGVERYRTAHYSIPAGTALEGAIFDHVHAITTTLVTILSNPNETAGASTYQLDVWPEHPMYMEARQLFREIRERASELRGRIDEHNAAKSDRPAGRRLNLYVGLSVENDSRSSS